MRGTTADEGIVQSSDTELTALLDRTASAQGERLAMVASASAAHPAVLEAGRSSITNITAEGYPGRRFHPGTQELDAVESLAIDRARMMFGAQYANVQPHSCTNANLAVLASLAPKKGRVLSLSLDEGGHLSHGAAASVTSSMFDVHHYGLSEDGWLDLEAVRRRAEEVGPAVIIAGASAYPRRVDFEAFRRIADDVGAYLLADISHIAGLVAGGVHVSPVDHAHATTFGTYKQLMGPHGGVILSGAAYEDVGPDGRVPLRRVFDRGVFPKLQGTPDPAAIAGKAAAFGLGSSPHFRDYAERIVLLAQTLASGLRDAGWSVLTGGTDNHMVILDLRSSGVSGLVAERSLEECGILANRNRIPGDTLPPMIGSGLRFGTNIMAQRRLPVEVMQRLCLLIDRVLSSVRTDSPSEYALADGVRREVGREVADIASDFPIHAWSA
ncbi:serine hydroxymethyltransferase [Curtobacterium sp. 24E2]|nr:serine hydroxymethyltransferase [Curtobacterium sp. 24E2]